MTKIKETSDYVLIIGISDNDKQKIYQIVNKEYEVIEVQTSILPQALTSLTQIQGLLNEYNKQSATPSLLKPVREPGVVRSITEQPS